MPGVEVAEYQDHAGCDIALKLRQRKRDLSLPLVGRDCAQRRGGGSALSAREMSLAEAAPNRPAFGRPPSRQGKGSKRDAVRFTWVVGISAHPECFPSRLRDWY